MGLLAVRGLAAEHHGPARPAGFLARLLQQRRVPGVLLRRRLRRRQLLQDEHADDPAERARGRSRPLLQPDAHRALERRPGRGRGLRAHLSQPPRFRRLRRCGVHAHLPGRADPAQRPHVERSGRRPRRPRLPEPQHPRRARGEHRHPPDAHGGLRLLAHGLRAEPQSPDGGRRNAGGSCSTTRRPSAPPATTAARASGASSSPTRSRIPGSIRLVRRARTRTIPSSDTTSARRTSSTRPIRWPSPRRTRPTRIRGTRATRGPSPRAAARSPTTSRPC